MKEKIKRGGGTWLQKLENWCDQIAILAKHVRFWAYSSKYSRKDPVTNSNSNPKTVVEHSKCHREGREKRPSKIHITPKNSKSCSQELTHVLQFFSLEIQILN